jgi:GST-like protein
MKETAKMIDLYFWTTPNGYKPLIFLEEAGVPYTILPVNISKGEQFEPAFLEISPNNRIPAIVDSAPRNGGASIPLFESGAILLYLAEKTGRYLPKDPAGRAEVMQWLFWQMGGLGPMLGQNLHFSAYAPEQIPYAIERYQNETERLYRVMDTRLADWPYLAGAYSIADMASYPWIIRLEREQPRLARFPNLRRWVEAIGQRPAVIRAYQVGQSLNTTPTVTEESKALLLGQAAA